MNDEQNRKLVEEKKRGVSEVIYSEFAEDSDLVDIIEEFAVGLADDVAAMRKVLDSGNHVGLTRLAHQMKGAGGSYGYPMLTETAKVLEDAAKVADLKVCASALDKLEALCVAVGRGMKYNNDAE
ncbi:MAG: Hpt domain-containing protein [Planctomycetes bacterium]|nr:Hpt domain-containing protein [Planctomycetota bacterium]